MDKIYAVRGTERAGPFTEAELRAQIASGALPADPMVWWEGLAEWTPLSRTPLAGAPAPTPPGIPGGVAVPGPAAPGVAGPPRTSALAVVALVLGILSIPMFFCYGLGFLFGLVAIILGHIARGQLARNPAESGKELALAGLICGYTSILLTVLAVIAICVLVALGNQVKAVFSTISSQMESADRTNNGVATPSP